VCAAAASLVPSWPSRAELGSATTNARQAIFDFSELTPATFLERPNRFTVRCSIDGKVFAAFLPNPGRLWEILLPGASLLVVPRKLGQQGTPSRLPFVVVAARKGGSIVFLDTHRTNTVARWLLETSQVPQLHGWRIVRQEVQCGASRFDFELVKGRARRLLEVKSVTLFHRQVAMFPDAVTDRGRRHLVELARARRGRSPNCVLFLVHHDEVDYLMPDYHTDYRFARTMLEVRDQLEFVVATVRWDDRLVPSPRSRSVTIPWSHLEREVVDSGTLLLVVGPHRKGPTVRSQWGIAVATVPERMSAYERSKVLRRKIAFELLRQPPEACRFIPIAIRGSKDCTASVACALRRVYGAPVSGLGTEAEAISRLYLFRAARPPLCDAAFIRVLLDHRLVPPTN